MDNQRFVQPHREQQDIGPRFDVDIRRFPKEFERKWSDLIDKRFALILLGSFVLHFFTALYFAINPPANVITKKDIARIQQQFASLVLDREVVKEEEPEEVEGITSSMGGAAERKSGGEEKSSTKESGADKGNTKETKAGTAEGRKGKHEAGVASRRRSREQISQEVSSKGILGLLSGSGSAASGEGVVDVLNDVGGGEGNLDEVLNQLDGIKVASSKSSGGRGGGGHGGAGGRGVRGSRATSGGGIDDLISDRGTARSTNVKRKGNIVVSSISAIESEEGKRTAGRDPDEVSAIVNKHNSAIQYCYQRELKRNPDLKGKLVVRLTIAPNGKVKNVKIISSTLNNPRVERCVISRIKRWDDFGAIDPAKGDAIFRQVYTFGY